MKSWKVTVEPVSKCCFWGQSVCLDLFSFFFQSVVKLMRGILQCIMRQVLPDINPRPPHYMLNKYKRYSSKMPALRLWLGFVLSCRCRFMFLPVGANCSQSQCITRACNIWERMRASSVVHIKLDASTALSLSFIVREIIHLRSKRRGYMLLPDWICALQ